MTVLVTGASGFIGRALTLRLLQDGEQVRALVREPVRAQLPPAAQVVQGDITDGAAVDRAVAGTRLVFHVAGSFRDAGATEEHYRRVNVEAVAHLIEAARRHGVARIVHTSTVGIHGSVAGPPANEDSPIRPEGMYEVTKAQGDALALSEAAKGDPEIVVIRPAPVYGPGDTRLVKLFRLAGMARPVLLGTGAACYQMLYIDDLVDAFLFAGKVPAAASHAFIIAGEEQPTLETLVAAIAHALGRPAPRPIYVPAAPVRLLAHACELACAPLGIDPPIYRRRIDFFTNDRRYDISKAISRLGFAPRVGLEEGLRRTAAWYRQQGIYA